MGIKETEFPLGGGRNTAQINRKLELNELEEIRNYAYQNAKIYKDRIQEYFMTNISFENHLNKGRKCCSTILIFILFPGKWRSRWFGPFIVHKVFDYGAIELLDPKNGEICKVNGHRLKPLFGNNTSI